MREDHDRFKIWISADLDGELETADKAALEAHLSGCAACRAYAADMAVIQQQVRAVGAEVTAPAGLAQRISADIARKREEARKPRFSLPSWLRWNVRTAAFGGAVVAAACALVLLALPPDLTQAVVANHVQSLQTHELTQIAASDRQVLKPWFAGRLGYAPPVLAVSDGGCRLLGGRIAGINRHDTAALSYVCGAHLVTVYVEPSDKGSAAPWAVERKGYHVVSWRGPKLACQAVSDLDEADLLKLARYIQAHAQEA